MAKYAAARKNYKPHNINSLTVTINGTHKVEALHTFEAEMNDDKTGITKVNSGVAQHWIEPAEDGEIRIAFLDSSATSDEVWDLFVSEEPFSITATDANAEKFDVKGLNCLARKAPPIKRAKEPDIPVWIFTVPYLDIKGGSYALATV